MQGLSSKLMPEPTWQRGVGTGEAAEAAAPPEIRG